MKTILCIIRASTEQQETDSQKKELVEFLLQKGFSEDEMMFIEMQGASAVKCNRKYQEFLGTIKQTILENNTIKNAACWHLNRLGRIESKLHELKDFFVKHGIQLYVKNPSITLLDEDGELNAAAGIAFSVYASMVKFETDEMFSKMKRGRNRNKENNMAYGGRIKFGYSVLPDKKFTLNPEEVEIIKLIFKLYSSGKYSFRSLTEELKERGIFKKDGKLGYYSVRDILIDTGYVYGHMGVPGFIEEDIFQKCKAIREKETLVFKTKESKRVNYCVGILKCQCGSNYIAQTSYYCCYHSSSAWKQKNGKENGCKEPTIRRDILDPIVIDLSYYLEIKRRNKDNTIVIEETAEKIVVLEQKALVINENKKKIIQKLNKLQESYFVDGDITETQYKNMKAKIEANSDKLSAEIKVILNEITEKKRYLELLQKKVPLSYNLTNISRNIGDLSYEEKKEIKDVIQLNILEIKVEKIEKEVKIWVKTIENIVFTYLYCPIKKNIGENNYLFLLEDNKEIPMYEDNFITHDVIEIYKNKIGID